MIKITLDTTQVKIYRKRMYIKGKTVGYDIQCGFWDLDQIIDVMAGHKENYISNQNTNQWTSTWTFNKDTNILTKTNNKSGAETTHYIDDYDTFMTNICEFYDNNMEAADAYKKSHRKGNKNPKPRTKVEKNGTDREISRFSSETNQCNSDKSDAIQQTKERLNLQSNKEAEREKEIKSARKWLDKVDRTIYGENLWKWKEGYALLKEEDWEKIFMEYNLSTPTTSVLSNP